MLIVDIIGSIDDKIENNNKIIDNFYRLLELEMKKRIGKYTLKLSECKNIEILKSGIKFFEKEKIYLDTSCVNGNKIVNTTNKITHSNRPSRANMQPIPNSVWFAKLKDSPKYLIVKNYSNEIMNKCIFSTGFFGLKIDPKRFNLFAIYFTSEIFDYKKNQLCIGATMQSINNESIKSIEIPSFSEEDHNSFNKFSDHILEMIYNLEIETNLLINNKQNYLLKFFK